jgi:predicted  nucleic acid-binding Zn-ribbon protein
MAATRKTDALIPLQQLDLEIHKLKVQAAEKPRLLAPVEARLAHVKETLAALQAETKALKLEAAKRELSVKEFEDRIAKIQAQSMTAKKNDEYQAYQKEISGVKAERARVEDGLLDIYMQVEEKARLEKVRQEEVAAAEKEYGAAKKASDAEVAALTRAIEEQLGKRAALAAGVEKEVLRVYERVLQAKDDGLALAPAEKYELIEDEGKVVDWQCGGCNVSLNMQDVNLLMMGREVHFCRSCSRLLFIKPA